MIQSFLLITLLIFSGSVNWTLNYNEADYILYQLPGNNLTVEERSNFITVLIEYGYKKKGLNPCSILGLILTEQLNNHFDKEAICRNRNGTNDYGLCQHNSRYWSERMFVARRDFNSFNPENIMCNRVWSRRDPVASLVVMIYLLSDLRDRYCLEDDYIFVAYHGIKWATDWKYTHHAQSYLRRFQDKRDLIIDLRQFYRGLTYE